MTVQSSSVSLHSSHDEKSSISQTRSKGPYQRGELGTAWVFLFVPGSTAALTTIEHEPGLTSDFSIMLERIAPKNADYEHEKQWHDSNGHSHVRAALIGPDLFIPVKDRKLVLGTWQQIVFIELDVRPRDRIIIVQFIGEE